MSAHGAVTGGSEVDADVGPRVSDCLAIRASYGQRLAIPVAAGWGSTPR